VIVDALGAVYGAAATWRRLWYAADPTRVHRLTRPVLSVGNLRVGGTGKTPTVGYVARLLRDVGERPAILSRGYARQQQTDGVTVVSDGTRIVSDVAHAGDEPMLLARALPGVPVLVSTDRYLAGRLGEERFGVTVHLLDDGFQHVTLARDIDLLIVDPADLDDRVLPVGRLREPIANAAIADAVLVPGADIVAATTMAQRLGVARAFALGRTLGDPVALHHSQSPFPVDALLFAAAGIARPERFFDDLRAAGLTISGTRAFRDHHRFDQRDVDGIVVSARAAGATGVVVTGKDAVRLEGLDLAAMPFAEAPLDVRVEPAAAFADWLVDRLDAVRAAAVLR
jgi:tetraacyldisaccharide 4'-kinase